MNILEKSITKIIAFILVISVTFVMTMPTVSVFAEVSGSDKAVTIKNKGSYDTVQDAVSAATTGDTIELNKNISVDMGTNKNGGVITIKNKELTIDGNGYTITGNKNQTITEDGYGSIIIVYNGAKVSINDLTVDGNNKAARHGIQANTDPSSSYKITAEAILNNVTAKNCFGYGVMVNGAELEATNLTTLGNGWGGVNVTQGTNVTTIPKFTFNSGSLGEDIKIKLDNSKQIPPQDISSEWVIFGGEETDGWRYEAYNENTVILFYKGASINSVSLNVTSATIAAGSSEQLIANVMPAKAYDKNITWSSINTNIATVSQKGMVTAKNPGVTTITALAADNKTKAECLVTVTPNADPTPIVTIEPRVDTDASDPGIVYLNTEDITETLTNASAGDNIVIVAPDNVKSPIVPKEVFEAATHSNAGKITIKTSGDTDTYAATFVFNKDSISDASISVNTGIFKTPAGDLSSVIDSSIPSGASIIPITLAHEGNFPGPVEITIPVTLSPGAVVYIYYVHKGGSSDGTSDVLELVNSKEIIVSDEGTITFTLEHASDYVISTEPVSTSVTPAKATALNIDKSSVSLKMKDSATLKAALTPAEAKDVVKWSSSNSKVATVDQNGKVTAMTPGTATITASVSDQIKDTCKVTVAPLGKPSLKVKSTGYKSVKATWTKVSLATNYQLYRATSKNGKYKKVKTSTGKSFTNKKLKTGKTYYYKVRSYVKVGNSTVYSAFTAPVKVKPIPSTPKLKVSTGKGTAKATWKKVTGATGYKVYRAKSKNGKFVMIKKASKSSTSVKSSNMTSGKTYYYKMRSYTKVGGKTVYSKYTKVLKIKVK